MNAFGLGVETPERMVDMFWKDGRLLEGRAWMQRFRFLLGRNGFLPGVGGDYLAWYRRDFLRSRSMTAGGSRIFCRW